MATTLKTKQKEKEKQIKLAKVTKRMKEVEEKIVKVAKHLAKKKKISPKLVEAIEQHLTTEKQSGDVAKRYTPQTATVEREEMAGIIEHPAKQQRKYTTLANNRFAALIEEEEVDHAGGCPSVHGK